jgi:hypothetical protein
MMNHTRRVMSAVLALSLAVVLATAGAAGARASPTS